jgi:hypothetical protein
VALADTHQSNQWSAEEFRRLVDRNERQEIRVAAAYDVPIDRLVIRDRVVNAILDYAMPAGNA